MKLSAACSFREEKDRLHVASNAGKYQFQFINMKHFVLTTVVNFFLIGQVASQKLKAIEPLRWSENMKTVRPVSGSFEIGLMTIENKKTESLKPEYFTVILPDTNYKYLCVKISSFDSRYSAELHYRIDTVRKPTNLLLHLPTQHSNQLKDYHYDELAIMSSMTNDCKNQKDFCYAVSTWNNSFDLSQGSIYLNSGLPATLMVFKNNKKVYEKFCETAYPNGVAYSKKCPIPLNILDNETNILIRIKDGGTPIDIPIPIAVK